MSKEDKLVVAMIVALLAFFTIVFLTACHKTAAPETPHVVVERRACIAEAPPQPRAIQLAEGCPVNFAACFDASSFGGLVTYLADLQRWSQESWVRCGPDATPTKEKTP